MPAFRWLWSGQVVSSIGDQVFPVAIVALVIGHGGTAGELGVSRAASQHGESEVRSDGKRATDF